MEYSIEEMRERINEMKDRYGWSYAELSAITNYSPSGIKKALKEGTLKFEAIDAILNAKNVSFEEVRKSTEENLDIKSLAVQVEENWEELKKQPLIKAKFEAEYYKRRFLETQNQ